MNRKQANLFPILRFVKRKSQSSQTFGRFPDETENSFERNSEMKFRSRRQRPTEFARRGSNNSEMKAFNQTVDDLQPLRKHDSPLLKNQPRKKEGNRRRKIKETRNIINQCEWRD